MINLMLFQATILKNALNVMHLENNGSLLMLTVEDMIGIFIVVLVDSFWKMDGQNNSLRRTKK